MGYPCEEESRGDVVGGDVSQWKDFEQAHTPVDRAAGLLLAPSSQTDTPHAQASRLLTGVLRTHCGHLYESSVLTWSPQSK